MGTTMKWWMCGVFFSLFTLSLNAFDINKPESKEFFIAYGRDGHLKKSNQYIHYTAGVDLCYPMPLEGMQFQLEPFFSFVPLPEVAAEAGLVFFIKYTVPIKSPVKPYVRGGSGVILLSRETEEQSSLFDFASQMGLGVSIDIWGERSLLLEYRYRHVSNCDLKHPNSGIDSYIWVLGCGSPF
mgnify:CR=1 FL=1